MKYRRHTEIINFTAKYRCQIKCKRYTKIGNFTVRYEYNIEILNFTIKYRCDTEKNTIRYKRYKKSILLQISHANNKFNN